jgi:hypothetical protein
VGIKKHFPVSHYKNKQKARKFNLALSAHLILAHVTSWRSVVRVVKVSSDKGFAT